MKTPSRRELVRFSGGLLASALTAGCAGTLRSGTTSSGPPLRRWVPSPEPVNGRGRYLVSDLVFWDFATIRRFEDELHPAFYDRITSVRDAELLNVDPANVTERIDVASQSARVYRGQFDTDEVQSYLVGSDGYTVNRVVGNFAVLGPDGTASPKVVGVGEDAVIVADGASIEMAGDDDRSSEIEPRTVLAEVIDARRGEGRRYAEQSGTFRTLVDRARDLSAGTVETVDPVPETEPGSLRIAGKTGVAHGARLGRPKSEYVLVLAFEDSSEVAVDPVKEFVDRHDGMSEHDDVTYATDGATLTVTAATENDRFDGFLPGDPGDRN